MLVIIIITSTLIILASLVNDILKQKLYKNEVEATCISLNEEHSALSGIILSPEFTANINGEEINFKYNKSSNTIPKFIVGDKLTLKYPSKELKYHTETMNNEEVKKCHSFCIKDLSDDFLSMHSTIIFNIVCIVTFWLVFVAFKEIM